MALGSLTAGYVCVWWGGGDDGSVCGYISENWLSVEVPKPVGLQDLGKIKTTLMTQNQIWISQANIYQDCGYARHIYLQRSCSYACMVMYDISKQQTKMSHKQTSCMMTSALLTRAIPKQFHWELGNTVAHLEQARTDLPESWLWSLPAQKLDSRWPDTEQQHRKAQCAFYSDRNKFWYTFGVMALVQAMGMMSSLCAWISICRRGALPTKANVELCILTRWISNSIHCPFIHLLFCHTWTLQELTSYFTMYMQYLECSF